MKKHILSRGNYLLPRSIPALEDESFFGTKPSGSTILPVGDNQTTTVQTLDDRSREQWAMFAGLLIVGSVIIDNFNGVQAAKADRSEVPLTVIASSIGERYAKIAALKGGENTALNVMQPAMGQAPQFDMSVSALVERAASTVEIFDPSTQEVVIRPGLETAPFRILAARADDDVLDSVVLENVQLGLLQAVSSATKASLTEVATILQTIYGHLDFILGTRDTPLEPVVSPLMNSALGQSVMEVLETPRQFPGPKTPDYQVEGLFSLEGSTNSLLIGSDEMFISSSLSRRTVDENGSRDDSVPAGFLNTSAFGLDGGFNWDNGFFIKSEMLAGRDNGGPVLRTGNIDQSSPALLGQEINTLDFVSLSGNTFVDEELGTAVGDFLPFNIDPELMIDAGSKILFTPQPNQGNFEDLVAQTNEASIDVVPLQPAPIGSLSALDSGAGQSSDPTLLLNRS